MLELEKYEDDEDKNVKNRKPGTLSRSQHGRQPKTEDEMALQECNKLSDLLALFHN